MALDFKQSILFTLDPRRPLQSHLPSHPLTSTFTTNTNTTINTTNNNSTSTTMHLCQRAKHRLQTSSTPDQKHSVRTPSSSLQTVVAMLVSTLTLLLVLPAGAGAQETRFVIKEEQPAGTVVGSLAESEWLTAAMAEESRSSLR
jgi:hypothetical protein